MTKVLISTFTFPPNKDGVSEAARLMAFGLANRGYDIVVTTGRVSNRTDLQPHPNIRVAEFDVVRDWELEGRFKDEEERMREFIISEDPDVIICHCMDTPAAMATEKAFAATRAKTIQISHGYTVHLWRPIHRPPFFGIGVLLRKLPRVLSLPWTLRKYDCVVFLSECQDFERFFDHKVAAATSHPQIRVIPNGTDPEPARHPLGHFRAHYQINDGTMLLCVANYSERKNQEMAIRAFRRARIPGATLVLIGSEFNDYSNHLMKVDADLRSQFPDGRLLMLEKVDRIMTMTAYADCDIFILTATAETQPISILEAMAAGRPHISTNTGCVKEMKGGIIADSETEIANAISELHLSPKRREELGHLGRSAVLSYYATDKVIESHERAIAKLLSLK